MPEPTTNPSEPRLLVVDHEAFDAHAPEGPHPEHPARLEAARAGLGSALEAARRVGWEPADAGVEDLTRVHPGAYVGALRQQIAGRRGHLDADTYFAPGSWEAATLAAAGAGWVGRSLAGGSATRALALLRPPGHHAEAERPMGFCLFNNVAVAAEAALAAGAGRVAIVDFDVHHGNGTQAIFERSPRVLFVSLHEWPLYPGTGRPTEIGLEAGRGHTVNVALPTGSGPEVYGAALRRIVLPRVDAFRPDVILVSAGFDAHARDPLGGMALDAATFGAMTYALAARTGPGLAGGIGVFLEGGYDLQALADSVGACARALVGHTSELPGGAIPAPAEEALRATLAAHAPR